MADSQLSRALQSALVRYLSPKEENILRLRMGLGYKRHYTLEEVGKRYKVTRERIRQMESRALRKLREKPQVTKALEDFL